MVSLNVKVAARAACPICGHTFALGRNGRKRIVCSGRCRKEASRRRISSRNGGPVSTTELTISVTKCKKLDNENNDLQTQKPDLGKTWVKVNEVTWKLTDGEMSRTSASHGQWGGYNTERGLAWIMDIGWVAGCASWYARCGDKSYGTASFADAKAAARAFVTGAALEKDELAFAGAVDLNAAAVKALESQAPQTMKAGSTGREKVVVSNNVKTTE
jgi:hypothetical protein